MKASAKVLGGCAALFLTAAVAVPAALGVQGATTATRDADAASTDVDVSFEMSDASQLADDLVGAGEERPAAARTETVTVKAAADGAVRSVESRIAHADAPDDAEDEVVEGSAEDLPISVTVTAWLDGEEVPVEDLAGQSGHVRLRYEFANTCEVNAQVGDADETMYTPFLCVAGLVLDNDAFAEVSVEGGRAIRDGNSTIVAALLVPGLAESLGVERDDDADGSDDADDAGAKADGSGMAAAAADAAGARDHFEVEADVEGFELSSVAVLAVPGLLGDLNPDALDELGFDDIDALDEAMSALVEGEDSLADALGQLAEGALGLSDGLGELDGSVAGLPDAASGLSDGSSAVADGLTQLAESIDGLVAYGQAGQNAAAAPMDEATLNALLQVQAALNEQLVPASAAVAEGASALSAGMPGLTQGISALAEGASALAEGTSAAADGADSLAKGVRALDDQVISKLVEALGTDIPELTDRLRALIEASRAYDAFAPNPDGETSEVRFIYQLDQVA